MSADSLSERKSCNAAEGRAEAQAPQDEVRCGVCMNVVSEPNGGLLLSDRRKGLAGEWRLLHCAACDVVSLSPQPSEHDLAEYYASYSNDAEIDLSPRRGSRFPLLRRIFHALTGDVDPRDFVAIPPGARVLDYGCGHGGYLIDFHRRGIAISGAEVSGRIVDECRRQGFDVRRIVDFSSIPFATDEFDVVYLMQVFEHLRSPHVFLDELRRVMKLGADLYLAVPNQASLWRHVFGRKWISGWFPPFHLFHYNDKSLGSLAKKHGFEVVASWTRTPVSWFTLNLRAVLHPASTKLDSERSAWSTLPVSLLIMPVLWLADFVTGRGDCLVVRLRKAR